MTTQLVCANCGGHMVRDTDAEAAAAYADLPSEMREFVERAAIPTMGQCDVVLTRLHLAGFAGPFAGITPMSVYLGPGTLTHIGEVKPDGDGWIAVDLSGARHGERQSTDWYAAEELVRGLGLMP